MGYAPVSIKNTVKVMVVSGVSTPLVLWAIDKIERMENK